MYTTVAGRSSKLTLPPTTHSTTPFEPPARAGSNGHRSRCLGSTGNARAFQPNQSPAHRYEPKYIYPTTTTHGIIPSKWPA